MTVLAHASGLFGGLPLPYTLFLYGMGAVVAVVWLVVRQVPSPIFSDGAGAGRPLSGPVQVAHRVVTVVLQVVGVVGWLVVLSAALFGNAAPATNISWLAVSVGFLALFPIVSVLFGDVWRAVSPYRTVGALLARVAPPDVQPPRWAGWLAPVGVLSLAWLLLAFHDPQAPRAVGWWLLIYSVVVLAGALRWGMAWIAAVEGFGVLFTALARMSVFDVGERGLSLRPPLVGVLRVEPTSTLGAVLLVYLGTIVFDGISLTQPWYDIIGSDRVGWSATGVATVGLLFVVAVVVLVGTSVVRVAAASTDQDPEAVSLGFVPALIPLVAGLALAHDLPTVVVDGQFLPIRLSDPYGEGWDLFGTASNGIDYEVLSVATMVWIQVGVMVLGAAGSLLVAHDVVLPWGHGRGRGGGSALAAAAMAVALATVGVTALLLGGGE